MVRSFPLPFGLAARRILLRQALQRVSYFGLVRQQARPAKDDGATEKRVESLRDDNVLGDGAKGYLLVPGDAVHLVPFPGAMEKQLAIYVNVTQGHGIRIIVVACNC